MTTNIFPAPAGNTTDADFRTWGSGVSTALAALGFVKTTDTGQISWATALKPATANTYPGFEIWRFNDSLQATVPIFIKLEFGSGSAASAVSIRFTIGKGSDGSGAITGVLLAATAVGASSGGATVYNWYMSSGDGSLLCFAPAPVFFNGPGNAQWQNFWVERSRAADGTATGAGLAIAWMPSNTFNLRVINYASGVTLSSTRFPVAIPGHSNYTTLAGGGKTPLFPGIVTDTLGNFWQPRAVLVGHTSDMGALSAITVQGFGTYLPMNQGWQLYDAASIATACAAIAWW